MKNSWPLAKTLMAAMLAMLMTQAGCEQGSSTAGTGSTPATASSASKPRDSSNEATFTQGEAKIESESTDAEKTEATKTEAAESESGEGEVAMMPTPKTAPPSGFEFEAPVRIKAGEEFVSVEAPGYACPTMADVDGDGLEDLVVGQFNQGHMQFCKNISEAGQPPKFAAAEWIKSGDDRAVVPGVW